VSDAEVYIHPQALVEATEIGAGTRIWAFAHVLAGARIGSNCNLGDMTFVEGGAIIGDNVTLKNNVCVWEGVTLESGVFVGPNVAFTNDLYPRSPRMPHGKARYADKQNWLVPTIVEEGCSIGANATIVAGVRLGKYCLVAAGAVVARDVEPFALVAGCPARRIGTVCRCGTRQENGTTACAKCAPADEQHDEKEMPKRNTEHARSVR
jgi:acetyltransferase-like isoleucine patch superfamily enzyme